MPRVEIATAPRARELHTDDMPIEQRPVADDPRNRSGDVILVDKDARLSPEYLAELEFMDEPVTIRLEPSTDKNAVSMFPVWVNGQGAEVFQNGRWNAVGWLPVGQVITVKRKVLEVIARTKIDTIHTEVREPESEHPHNMERRFTSAVHSFSVLEDRNPRGPAWLTEMRRRNF